RLSVSRNGASRNGSFPMTAEPRRVPTWAMALALAIVTFAVFAPSMANGFVDFDDPTYVYENTRVQQGLTADNIGWAMTTGYFNNWHPLTWLSYMIDFELYGLHPAGFHFTNVLFHALNAGLLVLVLTR